MGDRGDGLAYSPLEGRTAPFILISVAVVLLAATQGAIQQIVSGQAPHPGFIFEWRVVPVLIWAAGAPALLWAAHAIRRVTAGSWSRAIVAHASLAAAWIMLSNLLMRLPGALRGESLAALLHDAVRGAVEYGPGAAAAYVGLIAIGLPRRNRPSDEAMSTTSTTPAVPRRSSNDTNHLAIRDGVRIHMVSRAEVCWVEADGDHVQIHTPEKSYRTRATLGAYEHELEPDGFLRVHRSALVHPRAIREIQKFYHGDHVAILHDGSEVRIPRTRDDVIDALLTPVGED